MPMLWKDLAAARHSTLGLEIVFSVLLGVGLGYFGDQKFETTPYLLVIGTLYGIGAAVRAAYRAHKQGLRQLEKDNFEEASTDRPAQFKRQAEKEDA